MKILKTKEGEILLEVVNGEAKHPCSKNCENRCAGCKISCVALLEYKLFYKKEEYKRRVGFRASAAARKSGIAQSMWDKKKRKDDTEYYLKHNCLSTYSLHLKIN